MQVCSIRLTVSVDKSTQRRCNYIFSGQLDHRGLRDKDVDYEFCVAGSKSRLGIAPVFFRYLFYLLLLLFFGVLFCFCFFFVFCFFCRFSPSKFSGVNVLAKICCSSRPNILHLPTCLRCIRCMPDICHISGPVLHFMPSVKL